MTPSGSQSRPRRHPEQQIHAPSAFCRLEQEPQKGCTEVTLVRVQKPEIEQEGLRVVCASAEGHM